MRKWGSSLLAAIVGFCLLGAPLPAHARAIAILSPDHEQTWAWAQFRDYSWTLDHGKSLALIVTYTNQLLSSQDDPLRNDDFWFRFPSVRFDPATGNFFYTPPGAKGPPLLVAHRANGFIKTTALTGDALAVVVRSNGALQAAIAVGTARRPAHGSLLEIVRPDPFTLQSLIGETGQYH